MSAKDRLLEICPIAVITLEEAVKRGIMSSERMEKIFTTLVENAEDDDLWLENTDTFIQAFCWSRLGELLGEDGDVVGVEMSHIDYELCSYF